MQKNLLTLAGASETLDVISNLSIYIYALGYYLFNVILSCLLFSSFYTHSILPTFDNLHRTVMRNKNLPSNLKHKVTRHFASSVSLCFGLQNNVEAEIFFLPLRPIFKITLIIKLLLQ